MSSSSLLPTTCSPSLTSMRSMSSPTYPDASYYMKGRCGGTPHARHVHLQPRTTSQSSSCRSCRRSNHEAPQPREIEIRGHRAAEHRLALLLHRRAQHARVRCQRYLPGPEWVQFAASINNILFVCCWRTSPFMVTSNHDFEGGFRGKLDR